MEEGGQAWRPGDASRGDLLWHAYVLSAYIWVQSDRDRERADELVRRLKTRLQENPITVISGQAEPFARALGWLDGENMVLCELCGNCMRGRCEKAAELGAAVNYQPAYYIRRCNQFSPAGWLAKSSTTQSGHSRSGNPSADVVCI